MCVKCGATDEFLENGVCVLCWTHQPNCHCRDCKLSSKVRTQERTLNSVRDLTYSLMALTTDKEVKRLLKKSVDELEDCLFS